MGRLKDSLKKIKFQILSFRLHLHCATVRTAEEKKIKTESAIARLNGGNEAQKICAELEARRRITAIDEYIEESSEKELTYRYKKLKGSFAYTSVMGLFKLPRRFMLVTRISKFISVFFTVVEAGAFFIILLLLLPFFVLIYTFYASSDLYRRKRYADRIFSQSPNGIAVIIYSGKEKTERIDASAYKDFGTVIKVRQNAPFFSVAVGVDRYGCYYAKSGFLDYLRKRNSQNRTDITIIRL